MVGSSPYTAQCQSTDVESTPDRRHRRHNKRTTGRDRRWGTRDCTGSAQRGWRATPGSRPSGRDCVDQAPSTGSNSLWSVCGGQNGPRDADPLVSSIPITEGARSNARNAGITREQSLEGWHGVKMYRDEPQFPRGLRVAEVFGKATRMGVRAQLCDGLRH